MKWKTRIAGYPAIAQLSIMRLLGRSRRGHGFGGQRVRRTYFAFLADPMLTVPPKPLSASVGLRIYSPIASGRAPHRIIPENRLGLKGSLR